MIHSITNGSILVGLPVLETGSRGLRDRTLPLELQTHLVGSAMLEMASLGLKDLPLPLELRTLSFLFLADSRRLLFLSLHLVLFLSFSGVWWDRTTCQRPPSYSRLGLPLSRTNSIEVWRMIELR